MGAARGLTDEENSQGARVKTAISGRGTACSEVWSQNVIYLGIKEDVERRRLRMWVHPDNRRFRSGLAQKFELSLAGPGESWEFEQGNDLEELIFGRLLQSWDRLGRNCWVPDLNIYEI